MIEGTDAEPCPIGDWMFNLLHGSKVYGVETKCINCKRSGGINTHVGWIRAKDESKAKVERYVQFGVCPKCSLEIDEQCVDSHALTISIPLESPRE